MGKTKFRFMINYLGVWCYRDKFSIVFENILLAWEKWLQAVYLQQRLLLYNLKIADLNMQMARFAGFYPQLRYWKCFVSADISSAIEVSDRWLTEHIENVLAFHFMVILHENTDSARLLDIFGVIFLNLHFEEGGQIT